MTAVNMSGLTEIDEEEWVAIANEACDRQVWDWENARAMADDLAGGDPNLGTSATPIDNLVWMLAVEACREAFSPAAINQGPPRPRSIGVAEPLSGAPDWPRWRTPVPAGIEAWSPSNWTSFSKS
jgi:hypothetical protein